MVQIRPNTRVISVNFPNNPTGKILGADEFTQLVQLCDERGIYLFSDEVYRGLERDASRTLPQAADLYPNALSLNVVSKSLGLPGLRIGWIACRDRELRARLDVPSTTPLSAILHPAKSLPALRSKDVNASWSAIGLLSRRT